jgi:hypothetical protein
MRFSEPQAAERLQATEQDAMSMRISAGYFVSEQNDMTACRAL